MSFDLKAATPDTSFPANAFLFGADSQAAAAPSIYSHTAYLNYILSLANTFTATQTIAQGTITDPALNLSGTVTWNDAADTFTAWKLNVTNTNSAAASLLLDLQVGGSTMFNVRRDGYIAIPSNVGINFSGNGFFNTQGDGIFNFQKSDASTDFRLCVDASNTLALRNSTNAQTFRVYNTYTDASNYERLSLAWSTNVAQLRTAAAGTGTVRTLQLFVPGGGAGATLTIDGQGTVAATINGDSANNTYILDIKTAGTTLHRFTSTGALELGQSSNTGNLNLNGGFGILTTVGSTTPTRHVYLRAANSVQLDLGGLGGGGVALLQFNGSTSSFPALKRSSAVLQVRLADDSADADLTCADFNSSGGVVILSNLPTADPTVAGQLWNNSGVLTVSAG